MPEGIKIKVEYAQADLIRRAVDTVKDALRDGAILVVIILAVFLFNFRTALITLTAIPLSLIIAVIALLSQGRHTEYHDPCGVGDCCWDGG